jgi:hypothetical protein
MVCLSVKIVALFLIYIVDFSRLPLKVDGLPATAGLTQSETAWSRELAD